MCNLLQDATRNYLPNILQGCAVAFIEKMQLAIPDHRRAPEAWVHTNLRYDSWTAILLSGLTKKTVTSLRLSIY